MPREWTEDDDKLLRDYAAAGLSMRTAARALGRSRNAVSGRAFRLNIHFSGPQTFGGGCDREAALRGWQTRRERPAA